MKISCAAIIGLSPAPGATTGEFEKVGQAFLALDQRDFTAYASSPDVVLSIRVAPESYGKHFSQRGFEGRPEVWPLTLLRVESVVDTRDRPIDTAHAKFLFDEA